jgi:hypothetical protein
MSGCRVAVAGAPPVSAFWQPTNIIRKSAIVRNNLPRFIFASRMRNSLPDPNLFGSALCKQFIAKNNIANQLVHIKHQMG